MLITKSRLQGSSVVITLPSDNGKKPEENQEYIVVYSDDGTITLVPKIEDPSVAEKKQNTMRKMNGQMYLRKGERLFYERRK